MNCMTRLNYRCRRPTLDAQRQICRSKTSTKGELMLVMEKRPALDAPCGCAAELRVERTDIVFHDLAGDRLRIQVTVHNAGEQRSRPTPMRLESAPLGAFVAWAPLARLIVPALEPGESRELSTEVPRPRPIPLGNFDRVPPRRLLTALNSAGCYFV